MKHTAHRQLLTRWDRRTDNGRVARQSYFSRSKLAANRQRTRLSANVRV